MNDRDMWRAQDGRLCLLRRKRSGRAKPMLQSGGMSEGQLLMHELLHATEGPSQNGLWKEWAKLSRRAAAGGVGWVVQLRQVKSFFSCSSIELPIDCCSRSSRVQSKLAVTQATVSRDPSDLQGAEEVVTRGI